MSKKYPFDVSPSSAKYFRMLNSGYRSPVAPWERWCGGYSSNRSNGSPFHVEAFRFWGHEASQCCRNLERLAHEAGNSEHFTKDMEDVLSSSVNYLRRLMDDFQTLHAFVRATWKEDPKVRQEFTNITALALAADRTKEKDAHAIFNKTLQWYDHMTGLKGVFRTVLEQEGLLDTVSPLGSVYQQFSLTLEQIGEEVVLPIIVYGDRLAEDFGRGDEALSLPPRPEEEPDEQSYSPD